MKKIGLFLGFDPVGGGTFQYNQAILDALSCLPEDEFKTITISFNEIWKKI
jgi:hypothetical protein